MPSVPGSLVKRNANPVQNEANSSLDLGTLPPLPIEKQNQPKRENFLRKKTAKNLLLLSQPDPLKIHPLYSSSQSFPAGLQKEK